MSKFEKFLHSLPFEVAQFILTKLSSDPQRGAGLTEGDLLRFSMAFCD